jgi:predicted signal transduction protein with EAL and GGDEF domain
VPENRFVPVAEETGRIHALAEDLLRQGFAEAATWPADVTLSADVFPSQFKDPLLTARVVRLLHEAGLAPSRLQLDAGLLLGMLRAAASARCWTISAPAIPASIICATSGWTR